MAVRKILRMGHPFLLQCAREVEAFDTSELHALVRDMSDTMRAANGAGLAAPQIGVDARVVIFGFETNPRYPDRPSVPETVLVNPVIEPLAETKDEDWEGCLSVPGLRGQVLRYTRVRYRGFDPHGARIEREVDGFHARVVQHECDHLDGILYPMRIADLSKLGYIDELVAAGRIKAPPVAE